MVLLEDRGEGGVEHHAGEHPMYFATFSSKPLVEGMDKPGRSAYPRVTAVECPDADTLASLIGDALPVSERAAVANHAAGCQSCHEVISALMGTEGGVPVEIGTAPTAGDRTGILTELAPGARVDRYVIESTLGAGGMGVVYAALDPDLGRRVAVKLLRAGAADDRLRREAQALARLSHPNVVSVYDVGTHDGQIFVAMALVEGANLRAWLRTPRPVQQTLRHLIAAGRGLAAAHAAGLIHRDLKPDNIFVSDAGHALVGDFGLARELGAADDEPDLDTAATGIGLAAPDLTITGMVLGTPAYMGPEQADGEATAASDQFSFCVTAWEALYRGRPYGGHSFEEVQAAVRAGTITPPKEDPGVPSGVHRALLRGLSADPAARFPSMDELLAAMTPKPRRWPWLVGALGGLAGAGAAAVVLTSSGASNDPEARCAGTDDGLAEVWNPDRRAELERVLTEREPGAGAEVSRLSETVDHYVAGWNAMRHDTCVATDPQRPDLLASREACLDQRALALDTTLDLIATATIAPEDAWRLTEELRTVDRCAHATEAVAPPRTPELDAARLQLAEIEARRDVGGRWADLLAARATIETLGDPTLLLDALLLEARVALRSAEPVAAEAAARRAVVTAESIRDDLGKAEAGALLTEALVRLARITEAQGQLPQAVAALERGGGDWEVGIAVASAGAILARAADDHAGEIAARERILAQQRSRRPDDSMGVLNAALDLYGAYQRAGQLEKAAEVFKLLPIIEGDDLLARMSAAAQASFAATDALLAGDFPRAIELGKRVVAIFAELDDLPGPEYAHQVLDLGVTYEAAGDWQAALDSYREAASLYHLRPASEPNAAELGDAVEGVARSELELGHPAAAIPLAREALEIARAAGDADRMQTCTLVLTRALIASGHPDEVVALLEPVLRDLDDAPDLRANRRASAAFSMAQALWATGGERERDRARSLVQDAIRDFGVARDVYAGNPTYATFRRLTEERRATAIEWQARHP
jgi:tetratricopeptide (TPR) repeat protein